MKVIPKSKKPLESLTVQNREIEKRRLRGETEELVDAMGDTSEKKAAPIVKAYNKELEEQQQLQIAKDVENLKKLSNKKINYQRYLLIVLHRHVKDENIPKKYELYAESTDEGIVLGIQNTEYVGAFKVCGIPFYDLNACKILATQLGNTIGRFEGHYNQTDSGIIIPSKGDLEIAKRTRNGRRRS